MSKTIGSLRLRRVSGDGVIKVRTTKKNISNIYDRLIDHRDYLKTYEDKILRLETTLQRDLHYERERRKECEGRIDELTRALNESREKNPGTIGLLFHSINHGGKKVQFTPVLLE